MEILGLIVVILFGSIVESGLALLFAGRGKPKTENDPFIDARYSRMASEFNIGGAQTA